MRRSSRARFRISFLAGAAISRTSRSATTAWRNAASESSATPRSPSTRKTAWCGSKAAHECPTIGCCFLPASILSTEASPDSTTPMRKPRCCTRGRRACKRCCCEVDFLSVESIRVKGIHIIGDAIQTAPLMPKSGHMANQHAKVAAAAILASLAGEPVNPAPVLNNTCYSFLTDRDAAHVASVHQYDRAQKTFVTVPGAGGLSPAMSALEGEYALSWARNIWRDMLA